MTTKKTKRWTVEAGGKIRTMASKAAAAAAYERLSLEGPATLRNPAGVVVEAALGTAAPSDADLRARAAESLAVGDAVGLAAAEQEAERRAYGARDRSPDAEAPLSQADVRKASKKTKRRAAASAGRSSAVAGKTAKRNPIRAVVEHLRAHDRLACGHKADGVTKATRRRCVECGEAKRAELGVRS